MGPHRRAGYALEHNYIVISYQDPSAPYALNNHNKLVQGQNFSSADFDVQLFERAARVPIKSQAACSIYIGKRGDVAAPIVRPQFPCVAGLSGVVVEAPFAQSPALPGSSVIGSHDRGQPPLPSVHVHRMFRSGSAAGPFSGPANPADS